MFSITCTTCHARLKVRDESSIGSILPCPKCGSFVEVVRPKRKPEREAKPAETSPLAPRSDHDQKTPKKTAAAAAAGMAAPPVAAETLTDKQPIPPTGEQAAPPVEATPAAPTPPPVAAVADTSDLAHAGLDAGADADAHSGMDAAADIPNWTSPTELMWRKWLVLVGAPLGGMVLMVGLLSVFFSSDEKPDLPEQKTAQTNAEEANKPGETESENPDDSTVVQNRLDACLIPAQSCIVLSLTPADLSGQSGVERLLTAAGPLWTAAISPAIERLGLEPGQITRVTISATDTAALSEPKAAATASLIAIEIEPHVDLDALLEKGRAASDAWPYPCEAVSGTRILVTGPSGLVDEIRDRTSVNLASRPVSRLVESVNSEANIILLADVAAGAGRRYMDRAKVLFDVWPEGREAWRTICDTVSGIGFSLQWPAGIQADIALVCRDKNSAQQLDATMGTLLPAARSALAGRIKRIAEQVGRGEVQPLWADRYETFLKHGLSAVRPARRELADDIVWVRSSWNADPVNTALTSLDAVDPSKTDWLAAGLDCDRENQKKILAGIGQYNRAEGSYPPGAVGGALLPPESRLSWLALMLPYLDQRDWHRRLKFSYPWNNQENTAITRQTLPAVVNPVLGEGKTTDGFPVTHYVGVAGLGENAGSLSPGDPKAGVFGFGRKTRPQDISDGASNTIAVLGVCDRLGPWSAGGHATVRGLTQKPYVNGPDGFGSGQPHGMLAGMADGSTRFISKDIDPRVMEQMVTVAGEKSQPNPLPARKTDDNVADDQGPKKMSPQVKSRLDSRIERIEFKDIPLSDVIEFVKEFTTLEIDFDHEALERKGISDRVTVTADMARASVGELLDAVLAPHGLTCVERQGRLLITARR